MRLLAQYSRIGAALGVLLTIGCTSDPVGVHDVEVSTSTDGPPPLLGKSEAVVHSPGLPFSLALTTSNRFVCTERTLRDESRRDAGRWISKSMRMRDAQSGDQGVSLGRFSKLTLARSTHRQISQIDCVLPMDTRAIPFMKSAFGSTRVEPFGTQSVMASAEWTGTIQCYWNQGANLLDCDGIECTSGTQNDTAPGGVQSEYYDGAGPVGSYACSNGCTIYANGWDGAGYTCPDEDWGPGDGSGDGGSGGGGSGGSGDWSLSGSGTFSSFDAPPSLYDDEAAWSKWAHEYFIDAAFGDNNCPRVLSLLKGSSLETDLLYNGTSEDHVTRHAMRTPARDAQQANLMIDDWVTDQITEANQNFSAGSWSHGMWVLGRAIHTLIDRTSPAHTDANGNPRVWPVPDGEQNDHSPTTLQGKENVRNITPTLAQQNRSLLIGAMHAAFEGVTRPACSAFNI